MFAIARLRWRQVFRRESIADVLTADVAEEQLNFVRGGHALVATLDVLWHQETPPDAPMPAESTDSPNIQQITGRASFQRIVIGFTGTVTYTDKPQAGWEPENSRCPSRPVPALCGRHSRQAKVFPLRPGERIEDRSMPSQRKLILPSFVLPHKFNQRFQQPSLLLRRLAIRRLPRSAAAVAHTDVDPWIEKA